MQVDGKTGERQVPVSPEVLDLIWGQVAGDDVWPSVKGVWLTRGGIQLILPGLIRNAGIQRTRPGQRRILTHSPRRRRRGFPFNSSAQWLHWAFSIQIH